MIMDETEEKRAPYESPSTKRIQVELEDFVCGSAEITNPDEDYGRIIPHEINEDFSIDRNETGDGHNGWETSSGFGL